MNNPPDVSRGGAKSAKEAKEEQQELFTTPHSHAPAQQDDSQWGPFEDDERWCDTCGNLGVLICHCGGDLCVCMNQGEYPCPDCHD
jgi:hypothetical protein